jgi:hypothetical protein
MPAYLALLAIALRVLLPALHDHRAHQHADGHCCTAAPAGPTCSCGASHGPRAPSIVAAPCRDAGCLACELELTAPGSPVPVPLALPHPGAVRAPLLRRSRSNRPALRLRRHRARAPPATTLHRR